MRWQNTPPPPFALPGYSDLLSAALIRRGIQTIDEARAFLDPTAYSPTPPSALPGMETALTRLQHALQRHERICIWGDFDVDGQTATAILVETLRHLGGEVTFYIPIRAQESHGVHIARLKELIDNGTQLVVTCDTGITAHEAVHYAQSRGVDVIITDHHDLGETLPPATAIINPKLLPPEHPLASLPGAGVAYKLAEALLDHQPASLKSYQLLDLVALGIIADLAILRGDTRYLAQKGLQALRETQRLGLKTMMELAELKPDSLTETHIGFVLGPRLNALGRLEDANPAVELLTTQDPIRARVLATHLEGLNMQRKLLCDQVTRAAEAQLRAEPALLTAPILVLSGKDWPGGVLGIVAARLVERYGKPTILFSLGADGLARGSARSIPGLHITQAIRAQQDLLHNFGGHPMAAGLSLPAENLPEFRKRLTKNIQHMLDERHIEEEVLEIESWLNLSQLTLETANEIEKLAPFGPGNERIILAAHNLKLESAVKVGKGEEHLRLNVSDETGSQATVMWWGGGNEELPQGRFDLAFTIRSSNYKGQPQVTIEWIAHRETEREQVTLSRRKLVVIDQRNEREKRKQEKAQEFLSSVLLAYPSLSYEIWAEGEHKRSVNGKGRHELGPAETLVIWTTPPGRDVLQQALEQVKPEQVILICQPPEWDFLTRLTGVIKFVMNQRQGRVSLAELASATGERIAAVRLGLEYLSKQGQITVETEVNGEIQISAAHTQADELAAAQLKSTIKNILAETAAYRRYFGKHPNPIEDL
ncbi:MAG: single-stranded-DNA-specific exonuclease RecJ [Anaerolineae bacterium]|nr:MAG: single-stranded-DNA-specific exonuclease RecJ [Anaerolineae bacterium]